MLTRVQKQKIVEDLEKKFADNKMVFFIDYRGLNVGQMTELRKELKKIDADLKVAKKTLIDLVLEKLGEKNIRTENFEGQIALVMSREENEILPAQLIRRLALKTGLLKVFGGLLDKQFISSEQVTFLAKLSSREELLAKLIGVLQAPLRGFVGVLSGNLRSLVYILSQIKKA